VLQGNLASIPYLTKTLEKYATCIKAILCVECETTTWAPSNVQQSFGSSRLGLGKGLTIPHSKGQLITKCYTGHRTWTDSLVIGKSDGKNHSEDLGKGGRTILEWILRKQLEKVWTYLHLA
jgi:hypothetical protein